MSSPASRSRRPLADVPARAFGTFRTGDDCARSSPRSPAATRPRSARSPMSAAATATSPPSFAKRLRAGHTVGFDHVEHHLERGRCAHPEIEFRLIDLNRPLPAGHETFDLVTCFETSGARGTLAASGRQTCWHSRDRGGRLFITVPIESGAARARQVCAQGRASFATRSPNFRRDRRRFSRYLGALATNRSIAPFRDQRDGWGTHFGFDWREVERLLKERGLRFEAQQRFHDAFYRRSLVRLARALSIA